MDSSNFDWQSWLACGLGLLAVLHLSRRWWPKNGWPRHRGEQPAAAGPQAKAGSDGGCEVQAPGACAGGGCGSCGSSATVPIRVHRRTSHDTPGATPGH